MYKKSRRLAWDLEYFFVRSLAALINSLPIAFSTWIARRFGDFFYVASPTRRKIALENLNRAFKDSTPLSKKKVIAREAFRNLATSIVEFFRTPSMLTEASERFQFEGTEHLDQAFARGKGIIFTISHLGSWEYLAFLPYLRAYPCSVVVRETRNPYIYTWIQELRVRTRLNPITKKNSVRQIFYELRQNHLVAFLTDQWAGDEGIVVNFFNKPTSTTSIPVRIAKRTGAVLISGYCLRTACGQYKIIIKPEVPIEGGEDWERITTQKLNHLLEKEILNHPEQWMWIHRRWKELQNKDKRKISHSRPP